MLNPVDLDMFQDCLISVHYHFHMFYSFKNSMELFLSGETYAFWVAMITISGHYGILCYQNCHQTTFSPSADTGEMLEAKLRQQVQAHMWGLAVGAA